MQAGQPATRSAGVSEVVRTGRDRPGGSAETGGGINDEIGNGVRGGFGQGAKRDRGRRRGGVIGRAGPVERRGTGQRKVEHVPRPKKGQENGGKQSSNPKLKRDRV